jgi:uncharacterized membrane protein YeaQ/YmgE (transglycosylase-associated protein family)
MGIGTLIGLIVAGFVVGALARLFLPGKQKIGVLATILVGVIGTLVGYAIAAALGVKDTAGVDWIRWIISIAVSVGLVALVTGYVRRDKSFTRRRWR